MPRTRSKINRLIHLSIHLFAFSSTARFAIHSLFRSLTSSSLPLTARTAVQRARSKCRLLREPVSYVRNRSLPLVPPGVTRSQRKHVWHGAAERLESAFRRKVWLCFAFCHSLPLPRGLVWQRRLRVQIEEPRHRP